MCGTLLGWLMGFLSLFLIMLILIQRGKGGGLTGALLGPAAFLSIGLGLILQSLLFQFGNCRTVLDQNGDDYACLDIFDDMG